MLKLFVHNKVARRIDVDEVFSVPSVSGFDVDHKGRSLVYSTNRSGQWQLMLLDIASNKASQITYDNDSKMSPQFSPLNSNLIMFVKDSSGDEKFDIYLLDMREGKIFNLTPDTDFTIYPDPRFSYDGEYLTFVSNQTGKFSSYLLYIKEDHVERLTDYEYSDYFCEMSPDGKKVVVASHVEGQKSNLFLVHIDNKKEVERFVDKSKGNPIEADDPAWSPDGRKIAFCSSIFGYSDIGLWNIENGEVEWITSGQFEYYSPKFSPDGRYLAYLKNSGADIIMEIYDLRSKERRSVDFRNGVISSLKFSGQDDLYFIFSGPINPPDVWVYRINKGEFIQITDSLPGNIDVSGFAEGEMVEYLCLSDGRRVPALLHKPKGAIKGAVIEIHGGPTAQALNSWNPFVQLLVSRGYVVLRPNYRGSTGFGKEHKEANRFVMGRLDLDDCVSGYYFLLQKGLAENGKVAVAGASFGGYLTMCALTKYPSLWSCGVAIVPFLNWFTEIKNEREDLRFWDLQNMGNPDNPEDHERLREASPIFYINQINAPVLIIAGANDPRCPIEEAEQARKELEKNGKIVFTKFYKDEGHGFRKTKNRVDAYRTAIEFIERYNQ